MENLSKALTNFYMQRSYISEDKSEIYQYGFKLIIADIINFSLIIILGIIIKRFTESAAYLITLCGVRRFSGGFHAKTFWMCRLSMIITFICVISCTHIVLHTIGCSNVITVLNAVSVIITAILAPVKHPNKPLSERQEKQNKAKAVITSLILSMAAAIFIAVNRIEGVTISITLAAVVVLMIIGIAVRKGGKEDA